MNISILQWLPTLAAIVFSMALGFVVTGLATIMLPVSQARYPEMKWYFYQYIM